MCEPVIVLIEYLNGGQAWVFSVGLGCNNLFCSFKMSVGVTSIYIVHRLYMYLLMVALIMINKQQISPIWKNRVVEHETWD